MNKKQSDKIKARVRRARWAIADALQYLDRAYYRDAWVALLTAANFAYDAKLLSAGRDLEAERDDIDIGLIDTTYWTLP